MGKFVFNRKWLSDAKFSWVKQFKGDKHKAMCSVCYNKVIDIERMGESALKSHMKGEKHKRNAGATSSSTQCVLMATFSRKGASSSCDQSSESGPSCAEANNDEFFCSSATASRRWSVNSHQMISVSKLQKLDR